MYTDLLEEILLVNKSRDLKFSGIKRILSGLNTLFENDVYACLPPFKETLKGDQNRHEIMVYNENIDRRYSKAFDNLYHLRIDLSSKGLLPSLEEYDFEISNGLQNMEKEEKRNLHEIFNH
jgi:hypothetical protein